jgi:hypothetical protein
MFSEVSHISLPTIFPVTISDAYLNLGAERLENGCPTNGAFAGGVKLSVTLSTGESLIVEARGLAVQMLGEAEYVEEFSPTSELPAPQLRALPPIHPA